MNGYLIALLIGMIFFTLIIKSILASTKRRINHETPGIFPLDTIIKKISQHFNYNFKQIPQSIKSNTYSYNFRENMITLPAKSFRRPGFLTVLHEYGHAIDYHQSKSSLYLLSYRCKIITSVFIVISIIVGFMDVNQSLFECLQVITICLLILNVVLLSFLEYRANTIVLTKMPFKFTRLDRLSLRLSELIQSMGWGVVVLMYVVLSTHILEVV